MLGSLITTAEITNYSLDPRGFATTYWNAFAGTGVTGSALTAITSDGTEPNCINHAFTTPASPPLPVAGPNANPTVTTQLPVVPGQTAYAMIRGKLLGGTGNLRGYIHFSDSAGVYISSGGSVAQDASDGNWKDFSFSAVAPANAAYARVGIYLESGAAISTAYNLRATKALIAATAPVTFFDGASTGGSWNGTANASASVLNRDADDAVAVRITTSGSYGPQMTFDSTPYGIRLRQVSGSAQAFLIRASGTDTRGNALVDS
jgi:hypothetical protein